MLNIDDKLQKFREVETINKGQKPLCKAEEYCENYYQMTHTRNEAGRYVSSEFRYPHDNAVFGRYLSHCSCKAINFLFHTFVEESELRHLSEDDNAANKTHETRILEGESSSDESDEETHGNI
ncbi:UNVERIFIED_CONTAM: hypothetical protein NCL1_28980 [Trichonephila clavipes]